MTTWYQTWISVYWFTIRRKLAYGNRATPAEKHAANYGVIRLIGKIGQILTWQCAVLVFLCILCLAPVQVTNAAIYACKLADGSTTFQDTTCPVIKKVEMKQKRVSAAVPFGIEKTWFDKPPVIPDRAVCTDAGCHCGMFSREFKNGLSLAIADALYLDGSWHRLEATLAALESTDKNSYERAELRNERDEAACNILMSQKTLHLFGIEELRSMRAKKRYAEDMGYDNPEDCENGDLEVCKHTDLITLYDRIRSDIRALTYVARIEAEEDNSQLKLGAAAERSTNNPTPTQLPFNF